MTTKTFAVTVDYATLAQSGTTEKVGKVTFTPRFAGNSAWTTDGTRIVDAQPVTMDVTSGGDSQTFVLAHPEGWLLGFTWIVSAVIEGRSVLGPMPIRTPAPDTINALPSLLDVVPNTLPNVTVQTIVVPASVADGDVLAKSGAGVVGIDPADLGGGGGAPAVHTHPISDVESLQAALDGKAPTVHTHLISQTPGLQTTLDGKASTSHTHATTDITGFTTAVDARVQNIVGAAPAALDTLSELADALGDDANFAATMTTALAGKSATGHTHTKSEVGLSNVDNTSDAAKPVSTAQALALSGKADVVVYTGGNLTYKGATITSWPAGLTGPSLVLGYSDFASVPAWIPSTAYVVLDGDTASANLGRLAGITNSTGTTFTPALSDEGKLVTLTNAGTITVTLPTDASVAIPIGGQVHFAQRGSGGLTFAAASGATINPSTATTAATNSVVTAIKIAANVWLLTGALT